MLVLTRRVGEVLVIADTIRVTVVSVQGDRVRIGIEAPRSISVERKEVYDRRKAAGVGISRPLVAEPAAAAAAVS